MLSIIVGGGLGATVVVDSVSSRPLTSASVFDSKGSFIGASDRSGRLPGAVASAYPLTVRYLGYKERVLASPGIDTLRLQEVATQLPEVIVGAKEQKVLHMVAYVREYSTLTSYFDTVFLFREKMVDFMLPTDKKMKFKGWRRPRILSSKSYYRFTDFNGLDSVSDVSRHHFSWSDWIGVAPGRSIPEGVRGEGCSVDTVRGKYGVSEIWIKDEDKIIADVDVLSDTMCRSWVPGIAVFFSGDIEFDNFKVRFRVCPII